MSASFKLNVLHRAVPLIALLAGTAVAITGMYLMGADTNRLLTLGDLLNVMGVLAVAYLVTYGINAQVSKAVAPWRQRLGREIAQSENRAA
jgi:hypothetical protein